MVEVQGSPVPNKGQGPGASAAATNAAATGRSAAALLIQNQDDEGIKKLLRRQHILDPPQQVVDLLIERFRKAAASYMYDARDLATHAKRKDIEVADVRLAIKRRRKHRAAGAPQRHELLSLADDLNSRPLPLVPDHYGVRLPGPHHHLAAHPVRRVVPGDEIMTKFRSTAQVGGPPGNAADAPVSALRGARQPTNWRPTVETLRGATGPAKSVTIGPITSKAPGT